MPLEDYYEQLAHNLNLPDDFVLMPVKKAALERIKRKREEAAPAARAMYLNVNLNPIKVAAALGEYLKKQKK